jgi:hypothetical protein
MNATQQTWYAYSAPTGAMLRCAACKNEIDLRFPAADHHPHVCPACGVECAFLNWKGRTLQIVMGQAPQSLVEGIRWAQQHLDELEYVELLCALEEIADTLNADSVTVPDKSLQSAEPQ